MKRKILSTLLVLVLMLSFSLVTAVPAGAVEDPIDLSGGPYSYDIPDCPGDITIISFDYSCGTAPVGTDPLLRIPSSEGWMMAFNPNPVGAFSMDSEWGPFVGPTINLVTEHHFEFTFNESNGLFTLAVDDSPIAFTVVGPGHATLSSTSNPMADGGAVVDGASTDMTCFSDESATAMANVADVEWADQTPVTGAIRNGLGCAGTYRLDFVQTAGGYVKNIVVTAPSSSVPMTASFTPQIGITVSPASIDFGAVAPNLASDPVSVTVTNTGNIPEDFSATIENESDPPVYSTGLTIDGGVVGLWTANVGIGSNVAPPLVLTVPSATPPGTYTATLVFWAEMAE